MRRRPRLRRVLKWAGTVACLLMLAAFAASGAGVLFYYPRLVPQYFDRLLSFYLVSGSVGVRITDTVPGFPRYGVSFRNDLHRKRTWGQWTWYQRPRLNRDPSGKDSHLFVPLWIPFLLVLVPTAYLWYRDWRAIPPGHCQKCGYDLTGNESGGCPECGRPLDGTTNQAQA